MTKYFGFLAKTIKHTIYFKNCEKILSFRKIYGKNSVNK